MDVHYQDMSVFGLLKMLNVIKRQIKPRGTNGDEFVVGKVVNPSCGMYRI